MRDGAPLLPRTERLQQGLVYALGYKESRHPSFKLLSRKLTPYSTTVPCEIVPCRIGIGKPRRPFCKYNTNIDYAGHEQRAAGVRRGNRVASGEKNARGALKGSVEGSQTFVVGRPSL